MRVWIDTEFSDLARAILISVGLVAEDGRELYVELLPNQLGGWTLRDCSAFVLEHILPHLDPRRAVTLTEGAQMIRDFLVDVGQGEPVEVIMDYAADGVLVRKLLLDALHPAHELATWTMLRLSRYGLLALEQRLAVSRRHHALDDARALRHAHLEQERMQRDVDAARKQRGRP